MLKHLANMLTLTRLVLAPVVAWALWQALQLWPDVSTSSAQLSASDTWALGAAGLFIFAALTDLFDGMAARAFNGESKFGRIIDPIADKLLVGLPLAAFAIHFWMVGSDLWPIVALPVLVIVGRDALITLLRLTSSDGEGARVSVLAKWKTTLELIVVGALILGVAAGPALRLSGLGEGFAIMPLAVFIWVGALVLAAALSAWTGLAYLVAPKAPAST
jgi:cardiolipin synthase